MKKFNVVTFIVGLVAWLLCALFLFLAGVSFAFSASKKVNLKSLYSEARNRIVTLLDE